ncbi:MAG: outer membrane beta-barrel protein [Sphingomonadaceae bacterium]
MPISADVVTAFPIVPGAQEAGFVVPSTAGLFGEDALPAFGNAVIAATGFRASGSVLALYDDNFNRVARDSPGRRSQTTVTPTVSFVSGREVGRQLFFLNGRFQQNFRLREGAPNRSLAGVTGGWQYRLGAACGGRVQGSFSRSEVATDDFLVRLPTILERTDFFTSATCAGGLGIIPSVTFATGQRRFIGDFREFADSDYWAVSGSLGYPIAGRGQVGVQASYSEAEFPNQPLLPILFPPGQQPDPGAVNGLDALTIAGFISWRFTQNLSGNTTIGYSKTKSRNPLIDDFAGWTGSLGLSYSSGFWGAGFSVGRSVNAGQGGISNFSVVENVVATVSYNGISRVSLDAGASYINRDRRGVAGGIGGLISFEDEVTRLFFGARYRLNRFVGLNAGYNRFYRRLGADDPDVAVAPANQFSVGASFGF